MDKKLYFEQLRKSLEIKLNYYDSRIKVKCVAYRDLVVVFPPEQTFIDYSLLDDIRMAGGSMCFQCRNNHLEVVILDVLYFE